MELPQVLQGAAWMASSGVAVETQGCRGHPCRGVAADLEWAFLRVSPTEAGAGLSMERMTTKAAGEAAPRSRVAGEAHRFKAAGEVPRSRAAEEEAQW